MPITLAHHEIHIFLHGKHGEGLVCKLLTVMSMTIAKVKSMSLTEEQRSLNSFLETVSWGLFFVGLGVIFAVQSISKVDIKGGVFILVGALLIGLNALRKQKQIAVSKFTLFIGILLFLLGISDIAGFKLPVVETLLILIGLFIVLGAVSKRKTRS